MKQLKGKAREDFIKWYNKKYSPDFGWWFLYVRTPSEQFGVIQDFFDEMSIDIQTHLVVGGYSGCVENIINEEGVFVGFCKSRKKARKKAIKLASNYYNELNK